MDENGQIIVQASSIADVLGVGVVAWGVRALSAAGQNLAHIASELTAIRRGLDLPPPEPPAPTPSPALPALPRVS
jgi:hypothetical protein